MVFLDRETEIKKMKIKMKKIPNLESTYQGTHKGVSFIVSKHKGMWGAMTELQTKIEFGTSTKKAAIKNIAKYIEKKANDSLTLKFKHAIMVVQNRDRPINK
jgi:hypothetical protein